MVKGWVPAVSPHLDATIRNDRVSLGKETLPILIFCTMMTIRKKADHRSKANHDLWGT